MTVITMALLDNSASPNIDIYLPVEDSSFHLSILPSLFSTRFAHFKILHLFILVTLIHEGSDKKAVVEKGYNNNNIYLLQLGCHLLAVVILHVYKT